MVWRDVPLGRWLRTVGIAAAPLALALIILAALGLIPFGAAALTWLGLTIISAAAIYWLLGDLLRTKRDIELMARGDDITPAGGRSRIGRELAQAVQRLERESRERTGRLVSDHDGLKRALDALPGPVLLLTAGQTVVRANRAAKTLLGGEPEGRDLAAVLRNPDVIAALETAAQTDSGQDVAFTLQSPMARYFSAHIEPLRQPAADGTAIVLALVDVTAARLSDQMRADFIANASHEIRTPLATLSGFIETLRGPAKDDRQASERFLTIMAQHAERMTRLVGDLLSLSRIEMNEHTIPADQVNLAALLATVTDNLEWRAKERSVALTSDIEAGLPSLPGDSGELTQLFQNLIDNAIKYGREDGAVRIRAWRDKAGERDILVSIADEGEGIAREHLPRLTERFYRIDTARSRELGGTGLGLAIVKHIASRHRAELSIKSEPGKGSIFTLRFAPIAAE
ncbi:MAG: PAS domain-containing protein [Rhodospirillaceae bacterium]|nr:PAS domain-containing protein [Rhodospirillaceae bacterium]MBT5779814.1 PAS domain-containing protein [Rhodospirillaceae bacterium]MBT6829500.1 PAS domain-containing protein [Rhodospirillaceae bacterium]